MTTRRGIYRSGKGVEERQEAGIFTKGNQEERSGEDEEGN